MLAPEELLAGGSLRYTIEVPLQVLHPARDDRRAEDAAPAGGTVVLRPLTVRDLQIVARAAKDGDTLTATLMVQRALVEPALGSTNCGRNAKKNRAVFGFSARNPCRISEGFAGRCVREFPSTALAVRAPLPTRVRAPRTTR